MVKRMENEVKWKDYMICRWVVAIVDDTINDEFDSMAEAKKSIKTAT